MSHLHIPDGVLAPWVWASGLLLALVALAFSARRLRHTSPFGVAFQGALGGLVLVAMAIELPLGPLEYHLCLAGPVGVLLGPAAAFQVLFIVSAILAFAGHGGFTVIGLNALVLGAGACIARPLYRVAAMRLQPGWSLAIAAGGAQALSGLAWLGVVGLALHFGTGPGAKRLAVLGAFALPLWAIGVFVEGAVGYGLGRFLARVRPDLLPAQPGEEQRK